MNFIKLRPEFNLAKRLLILLIAVFFISQGFGDKETLASDKSNLNLTNPVSEKNLRKHLFEIAGDEYEGRGAGYEGEKKAAEYVAKEFEKYGLSAKGDLKDGKATYFQNFKFHPRRPDKPFQILDSQNVVGFIEGSDEDLKEEIVVIGCHYDGQGMTGQADAGRYPADDESLKDEIWNSADDNGVSVAVLLEVARIMSEMKTKPKRSVLFVAFGAEEHALNGSAYYAINPVFEWDRHVAMLNLEKLGRIPEAFPITASAGTSPVWEKITEIANKKTNMAVRSLVPELISDTDHYPFALRKIPAMVIGMAHEKDTHKPTDSADKISYDKLTERTGYVLTAFLELANTTEKLIFTGVLSNEVGFMPVVASKEEMRILGLSNQGGFKVSMLFPDYPSEKAGLRIGDVIISVDGKNFTSGDENERIFFKENISNQTSMKLKVVRQGKHVNIVVAFE